MKTLLYTFILSFFAQFSLAQSNTPCGIPSLLLVNATCVNSNGTTVGATYQNNAANGGTPSCGSPGAPDVWYQFTAPAGGNVNIQTIAGTITDGAMSLYSGNCPSSFSQIICDDDSGPGLMPQISATGLTAGQTYYIRFWKFGSGTGTFSICLTIPTPVTSNASCAQPSPICSGSPINFTANTGGTPASTTNPGNNYGCLFSTPNPSWYYLQIATGGNLIIDIAAGSDVDFAIWGPFPSLTIAKGQCNSYGAPVDCSFSTAATEQVNVPGTVSGQVYVLLVTNYANTIQNISVNNNGGTATTNCAIVPLPIGLNSWGAIRKGSHVEMNWTTASEQNNDYFVVQQSVNGIDWKATGIVDGIGTSSSASTYMYTDKDPVRELSYYRLKQIDLNGQFTYSPVAVVGVSSIQESVFYPNPANNFISLSTEFSENVTELFAVDNVGTRFNLIQTQINNKATANVSELKNGIYSLIIEGKDGERTIQRMIVQH